MKKKFAPLIIGLFLLGIFSLPVGRFLYFNSTASEPRGFYLITKNTPNRGVLVIVDPIGNGARLLKEIKGVQGDNVDVTLRAVYINGNKIAETDYVDGYFVKTGSSQLKNNEFFVMANHPRSYDSRYFGSITGDRIVDTVVPLWTWK